MRNKSILFLVSTYFLFLGLITLLSIQFYNEKIKDYNVKLNSDIQYTYEYLGVDYL